MFDKNRWAQFAALFTHIDEEAKELNKQTRPVAYRQHIGDGYFVSVNDGFMYVDIRKYFLPYSMQPGEEKPTKQGITLHQDEWTDLFNLMPIVHQMFPSLTNATACCHLSQLSFMTCMSCYPFNVPVYCHSADIFRT